MGRFLYLNYYSVVRKFTNHFTFLLLHFKLNCIIILNLEYL